MSLQDLNEEGGEMRHQPHQQEGNEGDEPPGARRGERHPYAEHRGLWDQTTGALHAGGIHGRRGEVKTTGALHAGGIHV